MIVVSYTAGASDTEELTMVWITDRSNSLAPPKASSPHLHRVSSRGRRGAVPSRVFDLRGAEAYLQSVEHTETRKRCWVLCIAGRSRKLVRSAG